MFSDSLSQGIQSQEELSDSSPKGFLVMNLDFPSNIQTKNELQYYGLKFELAKQQDLKSKGINLNQTIKLFNKVFSDANDDKKMVNNQTVEMKTDLSELIICKGVCKSLITPWVFSDGEQKKTVRMEMWEAGKKTEKYNINRFITGGCLFGTLLEGVDQFGNTHPLTDQKYQFPEGVIITNIAAQNQLHPYEMMVFHQLNTLVALMQNTNPNSFIEYHLPKEEYLLYGIDLYLKNQMTREALNLYSQQIHIRSQTHSKILQEISQKYNIRINPTSPLKLMFSNLHQQNSQNDVLDCLIINLRLTSEQKQLLVSDSDFLSKSSMLYNQAIEFLSDDTTNESEFQIWRDAMQTSSKSVNSCLSLGELSRDSYTCMVARVVSLGGENETALIDEINEKRIAHEYKRRFGAQYGSLLCFHWIPNLLFEKEKNGDDNTIISFHLDVKDKQDQLNDLYTKRIFDQSLLMMNQMYGI